MAAEPIGLRIRLATDTNSNQHFYRLQNDKSLEDNIQAAAAVLAQAVTPSTQFVSSDGLAVYEKLTDFEKDDVVLLRDKPLISSGTILHRSSSSVSSQDSTASDEYTIWEGETCVHKCPSSDSVSSWLTKNAKGTDKKYIVYPPRSKSTPPERVNAQCVYDCLNQQRNCSPLVYVQLRWKDTDNAWMYVPATVDTGCTTIIMAPNIMNHCFQYESKETLSVVYADGLTKEELSTSYCHIGFAPSKDCTNPTESEFLRIAKASSSTASNLVGISFLRGKKLEMCLPRVPEGHPANALVPGDTCTLKHLREFTPSDDVLPGACLEAKPLADKCSEEKPMVAPTAGHPAGTSPPSQ